MTPGSGGVTRLWLLFSADGSYEQCVGALVGGATAIVSFARVDPSPTNRVVLDVATGAVRQFLVYEVLIGEPATRPDRRYTSDTLAGAMAWLESQRAELQAVGWWAGQLDPIADPD